MGAGVNATKPPCPVTNGTAVPAIRPVAVPAITSLAGGQISVGSPTPAPTQIKVAAHPFLPNFHPQKRHALVHSNAMQELRPNFLKAPGPPSSCARGCRSHTLPASSACMPLCSSDASVLIWWIQNPLFSRF